MEQWSQRCALPTKCNIAPTKVSNGGNARQVSNGIGVADLQGKWVPVVAISGGGMANSLAVAAYGDHLAAVNALPLE